MTNMTEPVSHPTELWAPLCVPGNPPHLFPLVIEADGPLPAPGEMARWRWEVQGVPVVDMFGGYVDLPWSGNIQDLFPAAAGAILATEPPDLPDIVRAALEDAAPSL